MFPIPEISSRDTQQTARDEKKRNASPASFFYSQSQGLWLAVRYLNDPKRYPDSYAGTVHKHLDLVNLSLFGQLMAAFEYMLKDTIALTIDATDMFDDKLVAKKEKDSWFAPTTSSVLGQRYTTGSPGRTLIHPTMGWYEPGEVNERYELFFGRGPYESDEHGTVVKLWQIRHSVSHNAGFCTHTDAFSLGVPALASRLLVVTPAFFQAAVSFLRGIARRIAEELAAELRTRWLKEKGTGDFEADGETFARLQHLATYVPSRTAALRPVGRRPYNAARKELASP